MHIYRKKPVTYRKRLDDQSLVTMFIKTKSFVTSRPMGTETISGSALSPPNLLPMKSKVMISSKEHFQQQICTVESNREKYSRKPNMFW